LSKFVTGNKEENIHLEVGMAVYREEKNINTYYGREI
jgi:hypothetical protein